MLSQDIANAAEVLRGGPVREPSRRALVRMVEEWAERVRAMEEHGGPVPARPTQRQLRAVPS